MTPLDFQKLMEAQYGTSEKEIDALRKQIRDAEPLVEGQPHMTFERVCRIVAGEPLRRGADGVIR